MSRATDHFEVYFWWDANDNKREAERRDEMMK